MVVEVSPKVDNEEKFSVVLSEVNSQIPPEGITLEDFLEIIGERGLFMTCMILCTVPPPRINSRFKHTFWYYHIPA